MLIYCYNPTYCSNSNIGLFTLIKALANEVKVAITLGAHHTTILTPALVLSQVALVTALTNYSLLSLCRQEEEEALQQEQLFNSTSYCALTVMKRGRNLRGWSLQGVEPAGPYSADRLALLQRQFKYFNSGAPAAARLQRPSRTEEQRLGNTL